MTKIALSFVIMALAFGLSNPYISAVQFIAGLLYFCIGLKSVFAKPSMQPPASGAS
jgi:hypothetical protein